MGLKTRPPAGTKVRLTGIFLKNTGQQKGSEGPSRWIVQECGCRMCADGTHVATDEPSCPDPTQPGFWPDLTVEERRALRRHIAIGNLEIVGAKPKAEDYPGGAHDPPVLSDSMRSNTRRRR